MTWSFPVGTRGLAYGLLHYCHKVWRKHWATSFSLSTFMHCRRKWQPTPVFLPGESQGQRSLVGCCLWGHIESDTTEATYQQQQRYSARKKGGTQQEASSPTEGGLANLQGLSQWGFAGRVGAHHMGVRKAHSWWKKRHMIWPCEDASCVNGLSGC